MVDKSPDRIWVYAMADFRMDFYLAMDSKWRMMMMMMMLYKWVYVLLVWILVNMNLCLNVCAYMYIYIYIYIYLKSFKQLKYPEQITNKSILPSLNNL